MSAPMMTPIAVVLVTLAAMPATARPATVSASQVGRMRCPFMQERKHDQHDRDIETSQHVPDRETGQSPVLLLRSPVCCTGQRR